MCRINDSLGIKSIPSSVVFNEEVIDATYPNMTVRLLKYGKLVSVVIGIRFINTLTDTWTSKIIVTAGLPKPAIYNQPLIANHLSNVDETFGYIPHAYVMLDGSLEISIRGNVLANKMVTYHGFYICE